MFDLIDIKLRCPDTREKLEHKVLIKWRENRSFEHFKIGSEIKDLISEYNNVWIKTDYICESCSKKTKNKKYEKIIKIEDQKRHCCFIKIENQRIIKILPEKDFYKLGIKNYMEDL